MSDCTVIDPVKRTCGYERHALLLKGRPAVVDPGRFLYIKMYMGATREERGVSMLQSSLQPQNYKTAFILVFARVFLWTWLLLYHSTSLETRIINSGMT